MPSSPTYPVTDTSQKAGRSVAAMAVVNFTLSEEGVVALQNVLACMLKFSDDVCLEAKKDKVGRHASDGLGLYETNCSPLIHS